MLKTLLCTAFLAVSLAVSAQSVEPVDPLLGDVNEPDYALTEKGCAGARVLDHLERHGDFGVIDAEALLYLTRIEQDRWLFDEGGGKLRPNAIDGEWQPLGPTNGAGRTIAVALHPTNVGTAIVGAAGGGAWKTTNYGVNWTPLTDSLANLSVGAVAYAPSDANRVYLGTGEGGYAFDFIPGIGFLTSNDGGASWSLPSSVIATKFYRILVHPTNADDVLIGTNEGALRSTNGGVTWQTVIQPRQVGSAPNAYGDVTDIVRDPTNPSVLYAATWDRGAWCAGKSCAFPNNLVSPTVLKSTDGGSTWAPAAAGLPLSTAGVDVERFSLAISPSSPNVLYVLTATAESGVNTSRVYKTVNGGSSWTETSLSSSSDTNIRGLLGDQGWYDNVIIVSPNDPNIVIAAGVRYARTIDGGANWSRTLTSGVHVDAHDLRYDSAGVLWVANDGGVWTSSDNGTTSFARNNGLVTRQYYAMSHSATRQERILGGTQDNGTNVRRDGGGSDWGSFTGGDGFQCLIHPDVPGVAYSTIQFTSIQRTHSNSAETPIITNFSPPVPAGESTPFFSILQPDPGNPSTLYTVSTRVWKSTTAGEGWVPLSTTVTGTATWTTPTIRALTVSRSNPNVIVVSKSSVLYRTVDGGASWSVVSIGLPGRTITNIEIHPQDEQRMFVTLAGTSGPSVYLTTNGGTSWTASANGLPSFSALVIRYDVTDASVVYVGTDVGVYRSTDGGSSWSRFGSGLPAVSVYDLQMFPDASIIRAATHGRGIWELRNAAASGNDAPAVAILSPASQLVDRGTTLTFDGTVADPNGDGVTAKWIFPDDWSTQPASGSSRVSHTFDRPGLWPVTLNATDAHGAKSAAEITIGVRERGDDCANPIVIPSSGPYPWSITLNSETASRQTTDTPLGGSCYQFTPSRTFWFSFTPVMTGSYSFTLGGSRVAGFVASYSGAACGPYTELSMCSANTSPSLDFGKNTVGTMTLNAGTTYRFQVGSYFRDSYGEITVTVNSGAAASTVVRSLAPTIGSATGGTTVTITGSGFDASTKVRFGGTLATDVTPISSTILRVTTPPHAAGEVDVTVETGGTVLTASGAFTYTRAPGGPRRRSARH